jgi:di/tricarboxylate transporter
MIMAWDAYLTIGLVVLTVGMLIFTRFPADVLFLGSLTVLLLTGVLSAKEALVGMANEGMITVGVMYVIVTGLRDTGGVGWIVQWILGRPKSYLGAVTRLMIPTAAMSAFMNNTPLVAMMIPAVSDWAKIIRVSPSKLMIPLSYAAVLGGTCTLIGTSTNLVVHGLLLKEGLRGMGMFELAWIGVPSLIVGLIYCIFAGRFLLPERVPVRSRLSDPREYTVEMIVKGGGPLVGKSIEQAGLRHLPGMYLIELDREGTILPAVEPEETLRAGDRLIFAGIVESVVDLQRIRGLEPATNQVFKLDSPRIARSLIEAVVSTTCPLVGKSIREGRFRNNYNAVVLAVARNGERIKKKVGDIVLQPGDTLLVESTQHFVERMRNSRDFFLVSPIEDFQPPRHDRALIAIAILVGVVAAASFGWPMLNAAMLGAGLMILFRCTTARAARRSVDWQVLLVIAASFGLGTALEKTGAARTIATTLISLSGGHPWVVLAIVYLVTMIFTELITNNAAAALIFPIAYETSKNLGVDFIPFAFAITMAASACFSTPIGYQTNLMVMGPGGYKFTDYFKVGIPLNLIMWVISVAIIPWVWPFHPQTAAPPTAAPKSTASSHPEPAPQPQHAPPLSDARIRVSRHGAPAGEFATHPSSAVDPDKRHPRPPHAQSTPYESGSDAFDPSPANTSQAPRSNQNAQSLRIA